MKLEKANWPNGPNQRNREEIYDTCINLYSAVS